MTEEQQREVRRLACGMQEQAIENYIACPNLFTLGSLHQVSVYLEGIWKSLAPGSLDSDEDVEIVRTED